MTTYFHIPVEKYCIIVTPLSRDEIAGEPVFVEFESRGAADEAFDAVKIGSYFAASKLYKAETNGS